MTQQIKLRRDTASNYTIKDNSTGLVIGDGEVALETDKLGTGGLRLKIGDGYRQWGYLGYLGFVADGTYATGNGTAQNPTSNPPGVLSIGTGAPNNTYGVNGDIYFRIDGTNTVSSTGGTPTIYQKRSGSWQPVV